MLDTIKLYSANGLNERGVITASENQSMTELLRDNRYDTQWLSSTTPTQLVPVTILFEFYDRYGDSINFDVQKIILQNINIKRAYFTTEVAGEEVIIASFPPFSKNFITAWIFGNIEPLAKCPSSTYFLISFKLTLFNSF